MVSNRPPFRSGMHARTIPTGVGDTAVFTLPSTTLAGWGTGLAGRSSRAWSCLRGSGEVKACGWSRVAHQTPAIGSLPQQGLSHLPEMGPAQPADAVRAWAAHAFLALPVPLPQ
eukprot:scaffold26903_cov129-Isochrysis_galbana.AAC.8